MPEYGASDSDYEDTFLKDCDLFSLYLRYPDMASSDQEDLDGLDELPSSFPTVSSSETSPESTKIYSSPIPCPTGYETPTSSPLGPPDTIPFPTLAIASNEEEVEDLITQFDLILTSNEVPEDTAALLAKLKSKIVSMGTILFFAGDDISADAESIEEVQSAAVWLILRLKEAQAAVEDEIAAVAAMQQCAPFTVCPVPGDLWINYKQMAELIIDHTTIPSVRVLAACIQLSHIYDACVYRSMLERFPISGQDRKLVDILDDLYDAIMTLPTRYREWIQSMKRVGTDYTKPRMRRILNSPQLMNEILEAARQKTAASESE